MAGSARRELGPRNAQHARAAGGARRALRRACSGKWQMGGYINPRFLAGFDI